MQGPDKTAASIGVWAASARRQMAWLKRNEPVIPIEPIASARGVVLLVEPRQDKNLEFTIRNWMFFMKRHKYGLVIKHSSKNKAFVEKILEGSPNAVLMPLEKDDLRGQAYSNLMTTAAFWNSIPKENILLVQTDTMCLGGDGFDGVEEYDYAGAPWFLACPKTGHVFHPKSGKYEPSPLSQGWALNELWPELVGNGGLSFRKRSAMIECCLRFKLHSQKQGNQELLRGSDGTRRFVDAEDVFFAVACTRLRKKICPREAALRFAAEEVMPVAIRGDSPCCFGLHKVYPYHGPVMVEMAVRSSEIEKRIREEE